MSRRARRTRRRTSTAHAVAIAEQTVCRARRRRAHAARAHARRTAARAPHHNEAAVAAATRAACSVATRRFRAPTRRQAARATRRRARLRAAALSDAEADVRGRRGPSRRRRAHPRRWVFGVLAERGGHAPLVFVHIRAAPPRSTPRCSATHCGVLARARARAGCARAPTRRAPSTLCVAVESRATSSAVRDGDRRRCHVRAAASAWRLRGARAAVLGVPAVRRPCRYARAAVQRGAPAVDLDVEEGSASDDGADTGRQRSNVRGAAPTSAVQRGDHRGRGPRGAARRDAGRAADRALHCSMAAAHAPASSSLAALATAELTTAVRVLTALWWHTPTERVRARLVELAGGAARPTLPKASDGRGADGAHRAASMMHLSVALAAAAAAHSADELAPAVDYVERALATTLMLRPDDDGAGGTAGARRAGQWRSRAVARPGFVRARAVARRASPAPRSVAGCSALSNASSAHALRTSPRSDTARDSWQRSSRSPSQSLRGRNPIVRRARWRRCSRSGASASCEDGSIHSRCSSSHRVEPARAAHSPPSRCARCSPSRAQRARATQRLVRAPARPADPSPHRSARWRRRARPASRRAPARRATRGIARARERT